MHSNSNLTNEENKDLKQLIDKFEDTFAKSLNDLRSLHAILASLR